MSKVQGILRSLHEFGLSPKELFVRTNKLLCQDMEKKSFVTAIGGFFTPAERRLILARAGHLPLYYYDAGTGTVERIIPKGLGLGLEAANLFSSELEERVMQYHPNDVFMFVSDGITEAEGENGGQFGEESLMEHLRLSAGRPAEEIRDGLLAAVKSFANGREQHDDQTVVVVKALG
jgi:serine phosphatase RsbU (regulator of sigma subunit)